MSAFLHQRLALLAAALLLPVLSAAQVGHEAAGGVATMPVVVVDSPGPSVATGPMPPHIARQSGEGLFGVKPIGTDRLAGNRGAADIVNDMQLKGVVANNQAVNVSTGGNVIADGAFANTSGIPMVVQNSGNNVLIQNATIVNVQVK